MKLYQEIIRPIAQREQLNESIADINFNLIRSLEENRQRLIISLKPFTTGLQGMPIAADNATAEAAGVSVGGFYRTNADPSIICIRSV